MAFHRGRALSTIVHRRRNADRVVAGANRSVDERRSIDTSTCPTLIEATVEANPESATEEKLLAFQRGGINRISFGFQTANAAQLRENWTAAHARDIF